MVSLEEKIRRYNQNNNENFIIPSTELRFENHQRPPESLEIRVCGRYDYQNSHHRRSCDN